MTKKCDSVGVGDVLINDSAVFVISGLCLGYSRHTPTRMGMRGKLLSSWETRRSTNDRRTPAVLWLDMPIQTEVSRFVEIEATREVLSV